MATTEELAARLEKKSRSENSVNAETARRLRAQEAALLKFINHFGPLEDNHMLHEEARKCFQLAREALGPEAHDAAIRAALSN